MTERERVLSILKGEKPDKLPWLADLDYYRRWLTETGQMPACYENTSHDYGTQKMHRDFGAGYYLQGYAPVLTVCDQVDIKRERKGDVITTVWNTPVGTLHQIEKWSNISYSLAFVEHLIKDIDDLKIFTWVMEHTSYQPSYERAIKRYETIGDNGIVLCYTPKSPLMSMVAVYAGVENVTYMEMDEPEEFAALLSSLEEKHDEACRIALESPAECLMMPENISSECVAPFYDKYMKSFHKKWTNRIREAGKYSFVHLDGTVRGLVGQLSKESGFDVIEAITPSPVGDIALDEVANLVDERTIIWGGIPGGMFVESVLSDDEFEKHVKYCIETMTRSPRYVLGVADQVVPGSSEKRIRKVRELVDAYGYYK